MSSELFQTNENELIEALSVCLDALIVGSDIDSCLEMYPALAEELRPLLMAAQSAQMLTPTFVPVEAMNRSRTQALAHAATLRENRPSHLGFWNWWPRVPRFALSATLSVVVLLSGMFSVNTISARALPGDTLYPLKLSIEEFRFNLTPGSQAQEALQELYRERRLSEIRDLLTLGREEAIAFEGVFASKEELSGIAPERWLVSDIYILRTIDTKVIGEIEIGMLIHVEGHTRSGGVVEAYTLRPLAFAFTGLVEEITSDVWKVGGREVNITLETELDPGIGLGNQVMVLVEFDAEANILARAILLTGQPAPSPTPTFSPTNTPEPPATESPVTASPTPTPSVSSSPTSSPTASWTPTLEATEEHDYPTDTPEPDESETDEPEETEEPEDTDEPEETDEPTETDEPGDDNSGSGGSGGNSGSGGGDD